MSLIDGHSRQLACGLALVAIQAALFGWLTESVVVPVAAVVLSIAGVASPWRLKIPPERRFLSGALLGLPFFAGWMIAPHEPVAARAFLQFALVHASGQFLLCLQAVQFLIRQPGERLSALVPFLGTLVLICAADVYVTRPQRIAYQVGVVLFVLTSAGYYGSMRTFTATGRARGSFGRTGLELAGLALAAAMTWTGCLFLHRHWDDLERWFDPGRESPAYSGMGFSRQARLGSIEHRKKRHADSTALRVFSTTMPGYLRGAAYEMYHDQQWNAVTDAQQITPLGMQPPLVPRSVQDRPAFVIRRTPSREWSSVEVWKDPQVPADAVFAPLGATVFEASVESMMVDDHEIVLSTHLSAGQEIVAHRPVMRDIDALSPNSRRQLTWLAPMHRDDSRLHDLARRVFARCQTDAERVKAVEAWFHSHYRYSLSVRVPPGREPIEWFLMEQPAAHCEFFASGAALLLRLGGVPCRYVTGFVTVEYNPAGGYWLARNRDAHAWVEAYVAGQGWVTVEPTPGDGVPSPSTDLTAAHVLDDLWLRVLRLRSLVARTGWQGTLAAAWNLILMALTTWPGQVLISGTVLVLTARWLRSLHWQSRGSQAGGAAGELTRLLREMDRRVGRSGYRREAAETLHQFARRLQGEAAADPALDRAAGWYRQFAEVRYRGPPTDADVTALKASLPGN